MGRKNLEIARVVTPTSFQSSSFTFSIFLFQYVLFTGVFLNNYYIEKDGRIVFLPITQDMFCSSLQNYKKIII